MRSEEKVSYTLFRVVICQCVLRLLRLLMLLRSSYIIINSASSRRSPWPPQEFDQQAALDSALENQAAKDPDDVFGVVENFNDISSCRAVAEFFRTIFGAEKIMDPPFQFDSEDTE
jgi:hypothetical protein